MTAREFAETWSLPPDRTLNDAMYVFAEDYAQWVRMRVQVLYVTLEKAWEIDPHSDKFVDGLNALREFVELPSRCSECIPNECEEHHKACPKGWGRISDAPSQSYEARRGVGTVVESNTADEKACTHCEWTHGYHRHGCPNFKFIKPGSAETGGEKAAPHVRNVRSLISALGHYERFPTVENWRMLKSLWAHVEDDARGQFSTVGALLAMANVPRSSQNQTVSGGVEGAHEGTTADKGSRTATGIEQNIEHAAKKLSEYRPLGESRDPEKLNNAHPACYHLSATFDSTGLAHCDQCGDKLNIRFNPVVALAESSLSQKCHICQPTIQCDGCKQAAYDALGSSLGSPPPGLLTGSELTEFELRLKLRDADLLAKACDRQVELGQMDARSAISDARLNYGTPYKYEYLNICTTVRQSPSLSESGAESAHSGKKNTADKSELLPTQLPKGDL